MGVLALHPLPGHLPDGHYIAFKLPHFHLPLFAARIGVTPSHYTQIGLDSYLIYYYFLTEVVHLCK